MDAEKEKRFAMKYIDPVFRPPAEAESLIFQVAYGCPHNTCRFCGMYKGVTYRLRPQDEVLHEIAAAGLAYPETTRVFLADGDVMSLPFDRLLCYLDAILAAFPRIARIACYANGSAIQNKTDAELQALRARKLATLYLGLESGAQSVLDLFSKRESVEAMIEAVLRAQRIGMRCSVMILLGLGGNALREEHIAQTCTALNRMQPKLLSALRMIVLRGLPLPAGFEPVTEYDAVAELRAIVASLELKQTVFRANHTSNPLPLGGRFPADQARLLAQLDAELAADHLDRNGAGPTPLFL
ncbi:MAG: radical SAM protein [Clostridia bacterium]|nr:radical SAM protein [Clostridia bacterium]